ncbi:sugar phosphate isomerase/epimerase family protein [Mangrovibacterium sp.]|uniref:sugar phosphate isomerase/epimerase family protein n=1 Tax=Mangrovibacterium sp. TaxID=1961364 RepID=UPI00356AA536
MKNIGLQSYTVRDLLFRDFEKTIEAIAHIGYSCLELMNYEDGKIFNRPISEVRAVLGRHQLAPRSLCTFTGRHNPKLSATLINRWEKVIADAISLGAEYISCIYIFPEERENLDQYKTLADLLNRCGEMAKRAGIQLLYHNHDFEFIEMENQVPYKLLLANTDLELVKMEIDFYWIKKAGINPDELINAYPQRFPVWHIKDMDDTPKQSFTEVGGGIIDWAGIFQYSIPAGMEQVFVEQDEIQNTDPLTSITRSFNYLNKLLSK